MREIGADLMVTSASTDAAHCVRRGSRVPHSPPTEYLSPRLIRWRRRWLQFDGLTVQESADTGHHRWPQAPAEFSPDSPSPAVGEDRPSGEKLSARLRLRRFSQLFQREYQAYEEFLVSRAADQIRQEGVLRTVAHRAQAWENRALGSRCTA